MGKSSKSCRSLMAVRGKDGGFDDILGLIEADPRMKLLRGHRPYDVGSTIMKRRIDLLILGSSLKREELAAISKDVKRLDPRVRIIILLETLAPDSISFEAVLNADLILKRPISRKHLWKSCCDLLGLGVDEVVFLDSRK